MKILRLDGTLAEASYVRHLRTLTGDCGAVSSDVDLYRLEGGEQVECISPTHDCRVLPAECDAMAPNYPGYAPGR